MSKMVQFTLRLDENTAVTFKALAALGRTTPTALLRRYVDEYIAQHGDLLSQQLPGGQLSEPAQDNDFSLFDIDDILGG